MVQRLADRLAGLRLPDLRGLMHRRRDDAVAIRAEGSAIDGPLMPQRPAQAPGETMVKSKDCVNTAPVFIGAAPW
jgi:hypothetical protein